MGGPLDQRDLKRRHPLCPACGYDLIATLAADKRICPECGEPFSPSQLNWERRDDDWTAMTAVRMGLGALSLRLGLATIVAALLSTVTLWLADHDAPQMVTFIVAVVQLAAMGWVISTRLLEQAGFESMLLIIGACAAAFLAGGTGAVIASMLIDTPKGAMALLLQMVLSVTGAWLWIANHLILDAQ